MSESLRCPKCGIQLPADAPAGLCPKCLVLAGFESQPASQPELPPTVRSPPSSGFQPLSVEELAPLFPQLEILELLGKGGMGAVYKARQPGLDRLVAVKLLPPEVSHDPTFAERFQREARALARLSHPHIVVVYDFGQTLECGGSTPPSIQGSKTHRNLEDNRRGQAGTPQMEGGVKPPHSRALCYIVMEYVDGVNLRQTIQSGGLAPADALAIVPQICEALQYAHDEGIVHRDIKPENILIDKRGRVKIADFGLAKLMANGGRESPGASLTATHQVMGTLRYMAPEQMQGSREVDHRADIYSLGVVFYELLTGELPMGKFAPPSKKVQVDVRLDEIVLRALEQEPEQRYQHASEIKSDVENITRHEDSDSASSGTNERSQHPDTGTPLTQIHFMVTGPKDVAQQAVFHFSSLGYELVEQRADVCVFRRGGQWAGLWETDIRKIATRLTVRTAPADDGQRWVSCDWSVRTLGAWITRRDIRQLEAEGDGFKTLLGVTMPPEPSSSGLSVGPRFSRFAIAGAIWAGTGPFAAALLLVGLETTPTSIIGENLYRVPSVVLYGMGTLLAILALGAPFSTTILGAIAIGHIKRSRGKIIGLPLAVVDVLFFPLLAVFVGIVLPMSLALHSLLSLQMIAVAVPSAVFAAVVCFAIGLAVWRKLNPSPTAANAESVDELRSKLRLAGIGLLIAGIADAAAGCVWIGNNVSILWNLWQQGSPLSGQIVQTVLSLGSMALVYYVVGIGLWLMKLEEDCDPSIPLLCAAIAPPGCVIGLPAAIYAFVQLTKPETKTLFPKQTSDPQAPAQPAAASPRRWWLLPRQRPKLVPVLATFNLVGAIVLMLVCAMEEPAEFAKPMPRLWQVWEKVDAVLGFSMAAGMFAASIGLFLWKPWARKVTLGVCVFGLASFVFDAPYLARSALPDLYTEIQQTVIAEGVDPDAHDFVAMFTVVVLVGGLMLVGLTLLIGQVVYFTRPRVVAAFDAQRETYGKFLEWLFSGAGAVVGVLSVFGPLALLLGLAALFERGNSTSGSSLPVPPPRLGTITNGIGAEFTVPAGQVAVFEIVTRRDSETVPVPPHCGYVMASLDAPISGSLHWSRKLDDDPNSGRGRTWSLEVLTAGGGRGYSEGKLVPEELNSAVGARGLSLGTLEPNEEVIHWGIGDVRDLPANGLIGLRVTVVAHGMKHGGSGNAHIDWKKAQSATSTTRRKLTGEDAP